MYAAGTYWWLPRITSEIQVFNFRYLRSGHEQGCEGPWLFLEAKRGSMSKRVGGTVVCTTTVSNQESLKHKNIRIQQNLLDSQVTRILKFLAMQPGCTVYSTLWF